MLRGSSVRRSNAMKRTAFALLLVVLTVSSAFAQMRGTWSADLTKSGVQLRTDFNRGTNHYGNSFEISRSEFKSGATPGSVQFTVVRDAGTFNFTGTMKDNLAS